MKLDSVELCIGGAYEPSAEVVLYAGYVNVRGAMPAWSSNETWRLPDPLFATVKSFVANVVAGGPTQPLADFLLENGAPDWVGLAVAGDGDWWRHLPNRNGAGNDAQMAAYMTAAESNGGTA